MSAGYAAVVVAVIALIMGALALFALKPGRAKRIILSVAGLLIVVALVVLLFTRDDDPQPPVPTPTPMPTPLPTPSPSLTTTLSPTPTIEPTTLEFSIGFDPDRSNQVDSSTLRVGSDGAIYARMEEQFKFGAPDRDGCSTVWETTNRATGVVDRFTNRCGSGASPYVKPGTYDVTARAFDAESKATFMAKWTFRVLSK